MDKKMTIGLIVVVAVVVIIGALIAVGMTANNNNNSNTVTYDGNGGLSNGNATVTSDNSSIPSIDWVYSGYSFTGYNDKKDGTGTSYNTGDTAPYGKTLYAQYVKSTSMKIVFTDIPSYLTVMYKGNVVKSGDIFDSTDCKFTITVTPDSGYTLSKNLWSTSIIKEGTTLGSLSHGEKAHGTKYSAEEDITYNVLSITCEGVKELTLKFTAA